MVFARGASHYETSFYAAGKGDAQRIPCLHGDAASKHDRWAGRLAGRVGDAGGKAFGAVRRRTATGLGRGAQTADGKGEGTVAYRLMIVEDDETIAQMLQKSLCAWGFEAFCQTDFEHVLEGFEKTRPQLVVLDISLPYYNGYYWCEKIRAVSKAPILFVSSRSAGMDIVMAISMGGDDYVTKPFDMDVLRSKVQALLRRAYSYTAQTRALCYRGATIDLDEGRVTHQGQSVELTKNEQRILGVLLSHKGRIVSRDTLMQKLWDTDVYVDDNTLTVNVARLRKKLDGLGLQDVIQTRKGVGYVVEDDA